MTQQTYVFGVLNAKTHWWTQKRTFTDGTNDKTMFQNPFIEWKFEIFKIFYQFRLDAKYVRQRLELSLEKTGNLFE